MSVLPVKLEVVTHTCKHHDYSIIINIIIINSFVLLSVLTNKQTKTTLNFKILCTRVPTS